MVINHKNRNKNKIDTNLGYFKKNNNNINIY